MGSSTLKLVAFLLPTLLVVLVHQSSGSLMPPWIAGGESLALSKLAKGTATYKRRATVNLGIFCDNNFGNRFQMRQNEIMKYWQAVVYELHLMFKTLPSFEFTIQITALRVFENKHSCYKFDPRNPSLNLALFGDFLQKHSNDFPPFDLAVLVVSDNMLPKKSYPMMDYKGTDYSCKRRAKNQHLYRISVLGFDSAHPAVQLAQIVANYFGAPPDGDSEFWSICKTEILEDYPYILSYNQTPFVGKSRFFSPCTDKILRQVYRDPKANCIFTKDIGTTNPNAIFNSAKLFYSPRRIAPLSMWRQCQILTNDMNAKPFNFLEQKYDHCILQACVVNNNLNKLIPFHPLEMSHCGDGGNGVCFRGKCIEPEFYVYNVGARKCLVGNQGQFTDTDVPVVKHCQDLSLDVTDIQKLHSHDDSILLNMMYSKLGAVNYKSLGVVQDDSNNLVVKFAPLQADVRFYWRMEKQRKGPHSEFLLVHQLSNTCARVAENGFDVEVSPNCSWSDSMAKWVLVWPNGPARNELLYDYSNVYFILVCIIGGAVGTYLIMWQVRRSIYNKPGQNIKQSEKKLRMKLKGNRKQEKNTAPKFRQ